MELDRYWNNRRQLSIVDAINDALYTEQQERLAQRLAQERERNREEERQQRAELAAFRRRVAMQGIPKAFWAEALGRISSKPSVTFVILQEYVESILCIQEDNNQVGEAAAYVEAVGL